MENVEAILWLKSIKDKYIHGGDEEFDRKRIDAIDCAISALISTGNINVDRTKAMSDKELYSFLCAVTSVGEKVLLEWLKRPKKEEN